MALSVRHTSFPPPSPKRRTRKKRDRFYASIAVLSALIGGGAKLALLGHEVLGAEIAAAALVTLTGILRDEIPRE